MKKVFFLAPACVFTLGIIALNFILRTFAPLWWAWALLFWLGGVLLCKERFWGGLFGLIPAFHLVYMSTQDTGQVIDIELPLGIAIAIYFLACGLFVGIKILRKSKKTTEI